MKEILSLIIFFSPFSVNINETQENFHSSLKALFQFCKPSSIFKHILSQKCVPIYCTANDLRPTSCKEMPILIPIL